MKAKARGRGLSKPREARALTAPEIDATGAADFDEILTWAEVQRTHRIRNGVYQRDGRLVSLLTDFGRINACYPDVLMATDDGETILYTGDGRHGDQHLTPGNRALLAAIESGHAVRFSTSSASDAGSTRDTGASPPPNTVSTRARTGCCGGLRFGKFNNSKHRARRKSRKPCGESESSSVR